MEHYFPLRTPPRCRAPGCSQYCTRKITLGNTNGNQGRPYYDCEAGHASKFACWDDARDIEAGNPSCDCGAPGRLSRLRTGAFYACAFGTCSWTRDARGLALTGVPAELAVPEPAKVDYTVQYSEARPAGYDAWQPSRTGYEGQTRRRGGCCCAVM